MFLHIMPLEKVSAKEVEKLKLSIYTPMGRIIEQLKSKKDFYGSLYEGTAILAEENGKTVGWLTLTEWVRCDIDTKYLELNVFVDKEYRKKGIGTKLVECAENIANHRILSCPYDAASERFFNNFPGIK